jgi:hypothetical protein
MPVWKTTSKSKAVPSAPVFAGSGPTPTSLEDAARSRDEIGVLTTVTTSYLARSSA